MLGRSRHRCPATNCNPVSLRGSGSCPKSWRPRQLRHAYICRSSDGQDAAWIKKVGQIYMIYGGGNQRYVCGLCHHVCACGHVYGQVYDPVRACVFLQRLLCLYACCAVSRPCDRCVILQRLLCDVGVCFLASRDCVWLSMQASGCACTVSLHVSGTWKGAPSVDIGDCVNKMRAAIAWGVRNLPPNCCLESRKREIAASVLSTNAREEWERGGFLVFPVRLSVTYSSAPQYVCMCACV